MQAVYCTCGCCVCVKDVARLHADEVISQPGSDSHPSLRGQDSCLGSLHLYDVFTQGQVAVLGLSDMSCEDSLRCCMCRT